MPQRQDYLLEFQCGSQRQVGHVTRSSVCYGNEIAQLKAKVKHFEAALEMAWVVIANVSGGDWEKQSSDWQTAVTKWRDEQFHPIWSEVSARRAKGQP
jgi:hypothetical protein